MLNNGEAVHIPDVSKNARCQCRKRNAYGTGNQISTGVTRYTGGKLTGFIGFDNINEVGQWDDNDIALLRLSSEIIGNALERKEAVRR